MIFDYFFYLEGFKTLSWLWRHVPVIPFAGVKEANYCVCASSLGYTARSCLKNKQTSKQSRPKQNSEPCAAGDRSLIPQQCCHPRKLEIKEVTWICYHKVGCRLFITSAAISLLALILRGLLIISSSVSLKVT